MSALDEEYYITFRSAEPGVVTLKADDETAGRFYQNTHQLPGRPLHFFNGFREEMAEEGEKELLTDVMFAGAVFMIKHRIYQQIADLDIADLQYYSSVYEADDGSLHDYMFLIFDSQEERDWFDREESEYERKDDEEDYYPLVDRFVLDEKRLLEVPEEQRLMFRMTGVMNPRVFVHRRVVAVFEGHNATGIRFFRVSEWEFGLENE